MPEDEGEDPDMPEDQTSKVLQEDTVIDDDDHNDTIQFGKKHQSTHYRGGLFKLDTNVSR